MKKLLFLLSVIFMPLLSMANGWTDIYPGIANSIKQPVFKNKSYNIKKFGAKPESDAASNQHAINLAISACSNAGGGKVIVPEGVWHTGAIELKDNVSCTQEEIEQFCNQLPRYKRPKEIIFAEIPRNATGKIEKPKLRERYCGESLVKAQIEK